MPRKKPSVGSIDEWNPDEDWRPFGACRGQQDFFYPDPQDTAAVEAACHVCNTQCPVRRQCLEFALAHQEKDGIWGGFPEGARKVLIRQRFASA